MSANGGARADFLQAFDDHQFAGFESIEDFDLSGHSLAEFHLAHLCGLLLVHHK